MYNHLFIVTKLNVITNKAYKAYKGIEVKVVQNIPRQEPALNSKYHIQNI